MTESNRSACHPLPGKQVDIVAGFLRKPNQNKRTEAETERDIGAFIKSLDDGTKREKAVPHVAPA